MKQKHNWKADEMEMAINFKAMRLSWVFLTLSLLVWSMVDVIKEGTLGTPFLLLMVSGSISSSTKLWLTRRMTKPEAGCDEE